ITTMDTAKVQGGISDLKLGVAMIMVQLGTQLDKRSHHIVKSVDRIAAQRGIGRMSGLTGHPQGLHHDSLVHANWAQPGRLTDNGIASLGKPLGRQRPSATHGAFFVGRGQNDERDRKSTRLNSSHVKISYAVFCLKKKT